MAGVARSRVYPAIIAVLLFIIAAMAYKFIIAGSTQKAEDGRIAILLEPGERDLVLKEMRIIPGRYEGCRQSSPGHGNGEIPGCAARNDG
jgi:hypothetical protein